MRNNSVFHGMVLAFMLIALAAPAFAALKAVGPVDPTTGFPIWYQDTNNVAIELCKDPASALCVADPIIAGNEESERIGFGAEAFWWTTEALMDTRKADGTAGKALMVLAQEAAFLGGDPAPGDQMSFGRLRLFIDVPVAGRYKITHPFGVAVFDVPAERIAATNGIRAINANLLSASGFDAAASNNDNLGDIGCAAAPCDFTLALASGIGPFLKWDPAFAPAAPAGYLGDAATEHRITGGVNNFFRIEGPAGSDLDGTGNNIVQTDLFAVSGKIFSGPSVVSVSSTNPDGLYKTGDVITITLKFIAPVNVNTLGGTPELLLETGVVDKKASYESGSGTDTLVFKYTVNEGDSTNDLDYASANALTLNGGTISDVTLGTPALLGLIAPGSAGSLGANKNIAIDITPPAVGGSVPANGAVAPSVKTVVLTLKDNVAVNTVATTIAATKDGIALVEGTDFTRVNGANGASATVTLTVAAPANGVFSFTVTPTDTAGNIGTASVVTLTQNDAIPVVTGVTSTNADGPYGVGKKISITVTFSQAVSVTGTPVLSLSSGKGAAFESGDGTNTLVFGYTVGAGDSAADLDYASTTALSGSIKNAATNDAAILTLAFPGTGGSLGAAKNIVIDTTVPVLSMPSHATITTSSVIIAWTTDKPSDSTVTYKASGGAEQTATNPAMTTAHQVGITGLSASTQYTYNVKSCDAAGNCGTEADPHVFTTADAPVVPVTIIQQPAPAPAGGAAPEAAPTSTPASTPEETPDETGGNIITGNVVKIGVTDDITFTHEMHYEDSKMTVHVDLKDAVKDPIVSVKYFLEEHEEPPMALPSLPVHEVMEIEKKNFESDDLEKATITFRVDKKWIEENEVATVYLMHYENGEWEKLDTKLTGSTDGANEYSADVSSLSFFAVVGEKATLAPQPVAPVPAPAPGIGVEVIAGFAALLAAGAAAVAYRKGMFTVKPESKKGD